MKRDAEKFLKNLLNTPSPSGFEQPAAKLFRERVKGFADVVDRDVHGNSYAILNPDAKFKFMLAGHVDEIGLMITHIDADGFISCAMIGGLDPTLLVGQRVKVITEKGEVFGVIGKKAIHNMSEKERQATVKLEDIWVDIGADNKKEALSRVSIGDPIVVDVGYQRLHGNKIVSRATDDKAGAFIVAEVIRELSKKKLNISVIGVATVQEEIGLRGAITSSYNVKPDAGIAIDVGFAMDHPGSEPKKYGELKIGKGPNLHRGANINPVLEKGLIKTAKKHKIPFQVTAVARATGTDANAIQLARGGTAAALISIPNRYMHTPVELISLKDLENIIKLICCYLENHPATLDYRP